jgi:arylsulfatase A-like enzyme
MLATTAATSRGFEYFYGHVTGGIGYWDHVHGGGLDWQRNGETLREEGYATQLLADDAVRLIEESDRKRPLFLYIAFNAPHLPNEAPAETVERYTKLASPRDVHAAMVTEMDTAIGRVVDTLETQGMLEETLVWFFSDNGNLNPSSFARGPQRLARMLERRFEGREVPIRILEFLRVNILQGGG